MHSKSSVFKVIEYEVLFLATKRAINENLTFSSTNTKTQIRTKTKYFSIKTEIIKKKWN